ADALRAADPADFERLRAWHTTEASACERAWHWSEALWHLGVLADDAPPAAKPSLLARRAITFGALGDRERARAEYRKAAVLGGPAYCRGALLFDGKGDEVVLPHLAFDTYEAFTIEAWALGWSYALACEGRANDPENSVWMSVGPEGSSSPHQTCGWKSGRG